MNDFTIIALAHVNSLKKIEAILDRQAHILERMNAIVAQLEDEYRAMRKSINGRDNVDCRRA